MDARRKGKASENIKPIRVAVVVPKYGLIGGAENFVFQLTERLASFEDITIDVFANKWRKGDALIRFHKIRTIPFPRFLEPLSFALGAYFQTGKFDLIHSHDRVFAMDIFTFHGIPHTIWVNDVQHRRFPRLVDFMIAWIERAGITRNRLKKILPVSSIAARALKRCYPSLETKIDIMPPGIAGDFFQAYDRPREREKIRQQYEVLPQETVLLFVGMNFEIKNLDLVLESLAVFFNRGGRNLKLMVVGKGNEKKYRKKAKTIGIEHLVRFCGPAQAVQPFYLAADLFIMPSFYDTFGMVVLEAMLAGLPPVISATVGAKDLVDDTCGFVLPDAACPELVANIFERLQEVHIRQALGRNAVKKANDYFWDALAQRMADNYRSVFLMKQQKREQMP
ncbi:glycosyltransferase family 4 protein [Desulfobacter vibrioformis]|uniref:glycosyltransferase family 4 protein n=1 Tax=Desulfobacter vibrioformis TaxID=34031 RepID=UPI0005568F76|nr:glycosyltransferase family 4 protein [Desulfobacter vibrioformis]